jgi:hypothetical protein
MKNIMDGYTFTSQQDSLPDRLTIGHFMCDRCGKIVEQGLMNIIGHETEYHPTIRVYKIPTDNEMRIAFMELNAPSGLYEAFGFAKPTETEKEIFKKE